MSVFSNVCYKKPNFLESLATVWQQCRKPDQQTSHGWKTFLYLAFSVIFITYTRTGLKELLFEQTFILNETSLILKKNVFKYWK